MNIEIELGISSGSRLYTLGFHPSVGYLHTPFLVAASATQLTIKAETAVKIIDGTSRYVVYTNSDETFAIADKLDTGSIAAATNYYVYLCTDGEIKVSAASTYPSGYDADNSRKIGGFHTLCVAAGTISGHTLTGYTAGQILPASVWCLNHRPTNEKPEGMTYSSRAGIWVDIYLQSGTGATTASVYNATITDTRAYDDHNDDMAAVGKRLLWDHEFSQIAAGSNAQTNIAGSADPVTTGGKSDTAGRRMISNIGCEDCCGSMWQWLNDGNYYHTEDATPVYITASKTATVTHAASPGGNPIYLKYAADGTPYLVCNMATDAVDKIITFGSAYTLRITHDADAATGSYQVYFDEDATQPARVLAAVPGLKSEYLRTSSPDHYLPVTYNAAPGTPGVALYFDDGADERLEFISPTAANGAIDLAYEDGPTWSSQALGSLGSIYKQGTYGQSVKILAGGRWDYGSSCGPRCRFASTQRWLAGSSLGARGCCPGKNS